MAHRAHRRVDMGRKAEYRNRWLDALVALNEANVTMAFMADEIEGLETEVDRLRSKLAPRHDTSQIEGAENAGKTPTRPEKPIAEHDKWLHVRFHP
jgi:hypothetical protein